MDDDSHSKKLNHQLQQMAFQKYPFEINNKTFFCLQTYFEGQLLNGVDLQLKQAKGITSFPQKIAYLQQNQQIILFVGSNIVSYNAQKRSYSLITEVNGYVEILRTYSTKLNDKTYIYWLQSDQQGLNVKKSKTSLIKTHEDSQKGMIRNNNKKKITSILDFGKLLMPKNNDDLVQVELSSQKSAFALIEQDDRNDKKSESKIKQRLKKTVRIDAPEDQQQQTQKGIQNDKKKFRICIYDYENKVILHKQPLQIESEEIISEIFIFLMSQKTVGYVINDQQEQRAKIFYKKIKIDEELTVGNSKSKKVLNKKKRSVKIQMKNEKFHILNSIFQIPMLKYNAETDQYLMSEGKTVYSLQMYRLERQLIVKGRQSDSEDVKQERFYGQSAQKHKLHRTSMQGKRSSEQVSYLDNRQVDYNNLSREIQQIANRFKQSRIKQQSMEKQKYGLRINEEIELMSDEVIIDMSLSEIYLVVLTNQFIRFYSIFNLNTLLFKHQLQSVSQFPPPSSVQLNRSYLLLTHENSTFVSCYTILQRKLKYNSTSQVDLERCQSILKLFINSYNCQVAILARQYQVEGRATNLLKSKKIISSPNNTFSKTYLDISLAYINISSTKCETYQLFLKNQKFRNILISKWNSQYLIETQNQIIAKEWRQSFDNLKCSCIHPTGQYLIIGFNDCFKVYAVTHEGLQNTYMIDGLKDCQAITYSQYGDQFAVGSGNVISIYGSYNCTKKYSTVLPMNSNIQSLEYRGPNLICVLKSKKVIVYQSLLHYKQIFSYSPRQYLNQNKHELQKKHGQSVQNLMKLTIKSLITIEIYSLYFDLDLNVLIFSSGQKIFFINTLTNQSLGNYQFEPVSTMEYNKNLATLFLGTFNGELIAFPWPNKSSNILSELPRFKFHSSKIIKIKITSDFKYLITIGNDMSIYKSTINYILNLKRLKGSEIAQYKTNRSSNIYCNLLQGKGICQFSHSQNIQKLQIKKELEEEVVNTIFMLPEERLKQKELLMERLTQTKQGLHKQNSKQQQPLQYQSQSLRNKIYQLRNQLENTKTANQSSIQNEIDHFNKQNSDLFKDFSQMNYELRLLKLQFQEDIQSFKTQCQQQYQSLVQTNEKKEKQLINMIQQQKISTQLEKNDFQQLNLIEQEKSTYLKNQLSSYQQQIEHITSDNGHLLCQNSNIQKEIHALKYRIEQLKFVIMKTHYSYEKLQGKQKKEKQQKIVFETLLLENAKINVSEMEKKYIKATKELIEKNKIIDIDLNLYQKERQILIKLQKTVEKTQSEIDEVVESIQQEKQFKKYLTQKCISNRQKMKQLYNLRSTKKIIKNKGKSEFITFLNELHQLEKELQNCLNQNRRDKTPQFNEIMNKLIKLQQSNPNKVSSIKEQAFLPNDGQNLKHNQDKKKTKHQQKSKQEFKKQNKDNQVVKGLKKGSLNFFKQKKTKKMIRCSTEQRSINFINQDDEIKQSTIDRKKKQIFKVDHGKMLKNEFQKYRKDTILNQTVSGDFKQQSTQRSASPSSRLLMKTSNKYFRLKTEDNLKTQRVSNYSLGNHSPTHMKQFFSSTFRDTIPVDLTENNGIYMIEEKKKNVIKKQIIEQKLMNKVNTDKRLFMANKTRLNFQNQDLLNTFNSLTHENKYYQNLVKAYENSIKEQSHPHYRLNMTHNKQLSRKLLNEMSDSANGISKSTSRLIQSSNSKMYTSRNKDSHLKKLLTPFDLYLKNKQSKINQRKNRESHQEKFEQKLKDQQLLNPSSKIKKPETSQLKRTKTVPCVQLTL